MKKIGRVLWWDAKYERGVIVDPEGNEFYFDTSVTKLRPRQTIRRNSVVSFEVNSSVKGTSCARGVTLPSSDSRVRAERTFEKKRQLSLDI